MVTIHEDGQVEFRFYRPEASAVRIAGDFDAWAGTVHMRSVGRGWWVFDAQLPPGEYRFRYVADYPDARGQQWYADYAAFGVEYADGAVKGFNSVLIVPEIEAPVEARIDIEQEESEELAVAA